MEREEIIEVMSKPKVASLVPKYKIIYHMATGKPWRGCLCGNGFSNLWRACEGYANVLKQQIIKENKLKEDVQSK